MDKMHIQKTYSTARIEIATFFMQEGWLLAECIME